MWLITTGTQRTRAPVCGPGIPNPIDMLIILVENIYHVRGREDIWIAQLGDIGARFDNVSHMGRMSLSTVAPNELDEGVA